MFLKKIRVVVPDVKLFAKVLVYCGCQDWVTKTIKAFTLYRIFVA